MTLTQLIPYIVPAAATVFVAWLGLRPKKASPEQFMSEELKRMSDRIGGLEESNRKMWGEVIDLRGKVDTLYSKLHRIKGYALDLESHINRHMDAPYERPEDVDSIFKDH